MSVGLAICVNNSRDWVPQVPLSADMPDEVSGNPIDPYLAKRHPVLKRLVGIVEAGVREVRIAVGDIAQVAADRTSAYIGAHIDAARYLTNGPCADASAPFLNYVQCGQLFSLAGVASEEEQDDPLWQHHCGNYAQLLDDQSSTFR